MIKFFRKFRQTLLSEGNTRKYLKYAIGEIVLVVIGILIAIQINNWNESRKLKKEIARIEHEIHLEFLDNRTVLKDRITALENANQAINSLLTYTANDREINQNISTDSLMNASLYYGNYNPSNSTILELIGSGKLTLIENKQLKKNLYDWLQLLKDSDEDFKNQDQQATTLLIPYLSKRISLKNLNFYKNIGVKDTSKLFSGDYTAVFKDLEFENLYEGKLMWNSTM